jgi:ELWxxDGT repeat protein
VLVADTVPGGEGGFPQSPTRLGDDLLFVAGPSTARELWRTDGTPAGTQPVGAGEDPWSLVTAGPLAYFVDGTLGLASTDGTAGGTGTVPGSPADLNAGGPPTLTPWGSRLAFAASSRYWVTDGTAPGTIQLPKSPGLTHPPNFTPATSKLFFSGSSEPAGEELWVYESGEDARLVKDVRPGTADGILPWRQDLDTAPPRKIAALGDRVVFLADDGTTGEEPWISDGTEVGTFQLADLFPGPASSDPDNLISVGERAYFVADDGVHGREVWSSDGTAEGTRLLLDVVPGPGSSVPRSLTAVGAWLMFAADDPEHGVEAWVTDGTPEATFRLGDVAPGALSSSPAHFTAAGDLVYFAANDNTTGFELWAVPKTALDAAATDFFTVTPCRLYDSRGSAPLDATPRRVPVVGGCGIPATARAIAANVTALQGTATGSVRVAAAFAPHTRHTVAPFPPGTARAQQAILRLGYGELELTAELDGLGAVHVVVDVTGWFE